MKNTRISNPNINLDDMRIHYSATPSYPQTPVFSKDTNPQNTIQMKLKIRNLPEDPDYEFTVDDLNDIMEEVYYGRLEEITSEDEVRSKIMELIQDDKLYLFEKDYELNDYLYEYFSERLPSESESDKPTEDELPLYTGRLSEHKQYHHVIKPRILECVPLKHLQGLLRNKRQTNFDFYIRHGQQLYVSSNGSTNGQIDTGYDIVVYEDGNCTITERESGI